MAVSPPVFNVELVAPTPLGPLCPAVRLDVSDGLKARTRPFAHVAKYTFPAASIANPAGLLMRSAYPG